MPTTLSLLNLLTLISTLIILTATANPTRKRAMTSFNIHITAVQRQPGTKNITPNTVGADLEWNRCTKWSEIWRLAGEQRMDEMQFRPSTGEKYHIIFYRDDACKQEYGYIAGADSKTRLEPVTVAITENGTSNPIRWNKYNPDGEKEGSDYLPYFSPKDVFTGLKSFKVGKGACRNEKVVESFTDPRWSMCISKQQYV